jgi:hypothetical protein
MPERMRPFADVWRGRCAHHVLLCAAWTTPRLLDTSRIYPDADILLLEEAHERVARARLRVAHKQSRS